MNEIIINEIATELNVSIKQVETVLKLLEEGNTIPFIARYRKEATGALDEEQIRSIDEVYQYQVNLAKRKEDVIRLIDEKGLLTDELKEEIMKASKLVEVEDLYRPYKEKKKTRLNGEHTTRDLVIANKMSGSLHGGLSRIRLSLTFRIALHYCIQLLRSFIPAAIIMSVLFCVFVSFPSSLPIKNSTEIRSNINEHKL